MLFRSLVVDHSPFAHRFFRERGVDLPAPILSYYDWCGGVPFDIQKASAAMLTTNQRGYLLNAFGTGKTKTTLWAMDFLMRTKRIRKALVVAPLSTLQATWAPGSIQDHPGAARQCALWYQGTAAQGPE